MLNLVSILMVVVGLSPAQYNTPMTRVLTDVENGIYRESEYISGYNFTPECIYPWYIVKTVLHGGKQEGVEVINVNNGKLSFQVIPTRGMSVQQVVMGNLRLGWNSPVKGLVNPAFVNLMENNDSGWLEGFTEWMSRFEPGNGHISDNLSSQTHKSMTPQGTIANTPASLVEVVIDRNPPYRITIRGRVDEAFLHGPNLQLMTEISTVPGTNNFQISDTVTNKSSFEQEFGILYRSNYTTPLMEKDAKFVAAVKQVTPLNSQAAQDVSTYSIYQPPIIGSEEQVYGITLWADNNNRTKVLLRNAAGDKGVSMAFSIQELPNFTLLKNQGAVEDGYVTSLEPGTNFPQESKSEQIPVLAPHEKRSYTIDYEIQNTKEQVKAVEDEISGIKAGREAKTDTAPIAVKPETSSQKKVTIAELSEPNQEKTWEPAYTGWFGKSAPDFTITDITGKKQKVSDYRGKNLIINFWATWCPPCRKEIPDLIELRKTISEKDLAILGISTETGQDNIVKNFVSEDKMNYPILVADPRTLVPPYSDITAIPTSFFIDPEGKFKFAVMEALTLEEMKDILQAQ